jgi:hypothetical protein
MSKIVLNDVTNLNALSVINDNFDKLEQELQTKVLYRDNPEGEPNTLENDVDANGNSLYNIQDLTIDGNFTVNGKSIEEVIDEATQGIEDNALAAQNAATAAQASAVAADASADSAIVSEAIATTKASEANNSADTANTYANVATAQAEIATTQAGIATTKASEASTSASNAATSASTATTQAGIATTGASTATTQAGIATTQASNASTSATSAANSAAAAATALDSFDDRYLGSKSSDPTVDNDGNALLTGALYYNTTSQTMKVYDGANWITATAAGTTAMNVYKYVATAGQTTFSGAAAVGGTMSYTSGNIIVFVNGVSLDSTDYTATNGTSVVLGVAAALNDEVVVVAFKSFTVADTYTQSAANALLAVKAPLASPTFTGLVTTAGQIKFPATQNPSSDANTLDDYEEGTWTPDLRGTSANPTATYTKQQGLYTKIGNQVTASFDIRWSALSGGTGGLFLGSLPFTANLAYSGGSLAELSNGFTYSAGYTQVTVETGSGTATVYLLMRGSGSASTTLGYGTNINTGANYIIGSITYFV